MIIAFVFTQYIIVNAEVPTGSMKNTIMEHDRLIGFRLAYLFDEPERGDVVILSILIMKNKIMSKELSAHPVMLSRLKADMFM